MGLKLTGIRHKARRTRRTGKLFGDVAQLVERLICIQEAAGSIPAISTISVWSVDR